MNNNNNKRQLESSMSIPVYEGSMLSIRTMSSNPNRFKNDSNNNKEIPEGYRL